MDNLEDLISVLRSRVKPDRHELDTELTDQPELFYHASEGHSQASHRRLVIDNERRSIEARAAEQIRSDAERSGTKLTETRIPQLVANIEEVIRVKEDLFEADRKVSEWLSLKEAFQQKGYMLRELANLYSSNYYQRNSTSHTDLVSTKAASIKDGLSQSRKARPTL